MTEDEERWTEALAIEKLHGNEAPKWIAERIGSLAIAGDAAGVERFQAIAVRIDRLRKVNEGTVRQAGMQ